LEERWALDSAVLGQHPRGFVQEIASQVGVGHLAAAELHRHLDAVALIEELGGTPCLGAQVVGIDLDPEADLLEGLRLLLLLGFALALLDLVLVLAVVEDAADRRDRVRRDLHEVEALLLCQRQRVLCCHDAQLLSFIIDDPHLADPDHLIDAEVPCDLLLLLNKQATGRYGRVALFDAKTPRDYTRTDVRGQRNEPLRSARIVVEDGHLAAVRIGKPKRTASLPSVAGWRPYQGEPALAQLL